MSSQWKVKYKGNQEKDEVWIDMMKIEDKSLIKLKQAFGGFIPSPLPDGVLKVKFYIYKKKYSWIECNGKRIEFTYNLYRLLKDSENDHYELRFYLVLITSIVDVKIIPVRQDCYPKKVLIKYLINSLL